jgi:hypothetical protein
MSTYYGKCEQCKETGTLDPVVVGPTNKKMKLCYVCCLEYWERAGGPKPDTYRDLDDERKYGRYSG